MVFDWPNAPISVALVRCKDQYQSPSLERHGEEVEYWPLRLSLPLRPVSKAFKSVKRRRRMELHIRHQSMEIVKHCKRSGFPLCSSARDDWLLIILGHQRHLYRLRRRRHQYRSRGFACPRLLGMVIPQHPTAARGCRISKVYRGSVPSRESMLQVQHPNDSLLWWLIT